VVATALGQTPFDAGEIPALRRRASPCFVLLDVDYQIIGAESRLDAVLRDVELVERPPCRLPAAIERTVRELIAAAAEDGEAFAEAVVPAHRLLVRSGILLGSSSDYVAVTLEKLPTREPLSGAAERFRLSHRELQVLTLIMNGLAKREIAARLIIAESTVGEYFKHLYAKIGVRHRSALFARIFDWNQSDTPWTM
jgi:DNA-binding CsgD family transcriptional regulator